MGIKLFFYFLKGNGLSEEKIGNQNHNFHVLGSIVNRIKNGSLFQPFLIKIQDMFYFNNF